VHTRRTAALVLAVALGAFVVLSVLTLAIGLDGLDAAALRAVGRLRSPTLTAVARAVSDLGAAVWLAPAAIAIMAALLLLRRARAALIVGLSLAGTEPIEIGLKALFGRPRPSALAPLVHVTSASYPSGHAMISAALAAGVSAACWGTRWRWPVLALGVVYALAVSFSRVYLGVHYFTDVLAGILLAIAWVALLELAIPRKWRRGQPPPASGSA
jgi:membrane-associated phospholipid phosphatase